MNDLTVIAQESGLEKNKIELLLSKFGGFFKEAQELAEQSKSIIVTSEDQKDEMQKARLLRLKIKDIRTKGVEATRVELKKQAVRENKAIDGISNVIKALIVPVEEYLEKQEKFAEIKKAERLEKRHSERLEKLSKYVEDVSIYQLRSMTDEAFDTLFSMSKRVYEDQIKAEEKAQSDRIAKEKSDREEQEKVRLENIKLRKQAESKVKLETIEAEKREKIQARFRAEQEAKLKIERDRREKAEAKLRAEQDAIKKAEQDKRDEAEAEKKAQEESERLALLAPDKKKLRQLSIDILVDMPAVKSKEAQSVIVESERILIDLSKWIKNESNKL